MTWVGKWSNDPAALLSHPDAEMRSRGLIELAETDVPGYVGEDRAQVIRQVECLVDDSVPQVAASAAFALSKIGTTESLPRLLGALHKAKDREVHLSRQILIALFDLTDGEDVGMLEPALTSVLREVRELGVDLIAHASDKNAIAVLTRRHAEEDDPIVQDVLAEHLRRMRGD